jgi:hypothetical protein
MLVAFAFASSSIVQRLSAPAFSHFMTLARRDFHGLLPRRGRWLKKSTLARVCDEVERLRARAIAARYRYLVDNFCDAARDLGLEPTVHPEQWMIAGQGRWR